MRTSRPIRRTSLMGALAAVLVAATGCGGGGDSAETNSAEPSSSAPVKITVGDIQGSPASFLNFGNSQGIFADHGLDLEVKPQQGGAAIIPGLVSGELQFGGSNVVSMLLARDKDLPVQIVAPGTFVGTDPEKDFSAVIVAADSPIQEPADLIGKTIAVNTLNNVNDVVLKSYLQKQGLDFNNINLVELPFPEMLAAVDGNQVDAAAVIEPFEAIAKSQGARVLWHPYVEAKENLQIGTYSAMESYIQENPEVVKAFQEACAEVAQYITDHPEEYRQSLTETAGLKPEQVDTVNIPVWNAEVDMDSLEFFAEKMVEYGMVTDKPDTESAVYTG